MRVILTIAAAALLIGGCNNSERDRGRSRDRDRTEQRDRDRDSDRSADSDRASNSQADTSDRSADRGSSEEVTEAWLEGRWADSRDCTRDPVVFSSNGEFEAANGGRGRWSIESGGTLVLEAGGQRRTANLERVSNDELKMDGAGRSYRCD
jgi:Ni/Co efflux regulator RcnB